MTCKGPNCTSDGKTPHSSECLFEYRANIASGIEEVIMPNPTNESIGRAFREVDAEYPKAKPPCNVFTRLVLDRARELDRQAPGDAVLTNPYTGKPRDWQDVESDPSGILIHDGGPLAAWVNPEVEYQAADSWAVHRCLDENGVPRADDAGAELSLWGRVLRFRDAAPQPPAQEQGDGFEFFTAPEGLHPETVNLIARFASALAEKLAEAERKYGWDTHWQSPAWMDQCREQLVDHVAKGDPRDVASYCAFLWHHGESTALTRAAGAEDVDTESASFKEGMKLGRSESDFLCGMIENPQCQTCGARNAKEAETMCRPSCDGCPGTGWPLEKLWSLQAGAEDARDAERYRFIRDVPWEGTPLARVIHGQRNAYWDSSIDNAMAIASQSQGGES
jgi:hypothetical protein